MTIKTLLIASLLISSTSVYSADIFVVQDIYFKGLKRVSFGAALLSMPIRIGDRITNADIRNAIRSLFATRNFENIQILREKNSLIVQVKENPIISSITISGNKIIKKEILNQNLESQGVKVGYLLDRSTIFNFKKELEEFYYSIGKYNAQIDVKTTVLPRNCVSLKFLFNEGVSAKVKKISFIGNRAFTNKQLISHFQLHDKVSWWNLLNDRRYQKQKMIEDLENLHNFYLDRGYACFRVNSVLTKLSTNKKNVYITINLTEGQQYRLSNTIIDSAIAEYYPEVVQLVNIQPGELYNSAKINKIKYAIKQMLSSYGYAYPSVTTRYEINESQKTIELHYIIDVGSRLYVRNIRFEGNYVTQDSVLRREMRQIEGSWLDNSLVDQGKERLNRLGYFENVDVAINRVPGSPDQVDIIYKVKERNTGGINFSAGFGTESGFSFQFSMQQDNWLGTGSSVNFTGTKNYHQNHIELSMNDPFISMNGVNLGGKIFYNNFNTNDTELSDYDLLSYGVGTNLSFPTSEKHSFGLDISYINNDLTNIKPQIIMWRYLNSVGISPTVKENQDNNHTGFKSNDVFLSTNWNYNSLNRGYFPTSGSRVNIRSKVTLPGSNNEYYKVMFDVNHYISLKENSHWVLMNKIRLGYADGISRKDVPFYDNFYVSGPNSMRGFRSNTIGPKAVYYKCTIPNTNYSECLVSKSNDAVGGNVIFVTSAELIVPIPCLKEEYINLVRTSLFIDGGTIWDSNWQNTKATYDAGIPDYSNPRNLRISGGISLQWRSPIGPLIFSYAKKVKKYDGDKLEQFRFNIGKTW